MGMSKAIWGRDSALSNQIESGEELPKGKTRVFPKDGSIAGIHYGQFTLWITLGHKFLCTYVFLTPG